MIWLENEFLPSLCAQPVLRAALSLAAELWVAAGSVKRAAHLLLFPPPLTGPPMKIDLHIYRPKDLKRDGLAKIIQQAWEMGAEKLCLVHGHGRSRGRSPGGAAMTGVTFGSRAKIPRRATPLPADRRTFARSPPARPA